MSTVCGESRVLPESTVLPENIAPGCKNDRASVTIGYGFIIFIVFIIIFSAPVFRNSDNSIWIMTSLLLIVLILPTFLGLILTLLVGICVLLLSISQIGSRDEVM